MNALLLISLLFAAPDVRVVAPQDLFDSALLVTVQP
jgi:hypothetical protein